MEACDPKLFILIYLVDFNKQTSRTWVSENMCHYSKSEIGNSVTTNTWFIFYLIISISITLSHAPARRLLSSTHYLRRNMNFCRAISGLTSYHRITRDANKPVLLSSQWNSFRYPATPVSSRHPRIHPFPFVYSHPFTWHPEIHDTLVVL